MQHRRAKVTEHCFWVTNISNRNVALSDLALTIPSKRTMNLLDKKHFHYSLEELEQSAKNGSLYKKSDKIKVRNVPPEILVKPGIYVLHEPLSAKPRTTIKIVEKHYEELNVSDEKYAEELIKDD